MGEAKEGTSLADYAADGHVSLRFGYLGEIKQRIRAFVAGDESEFV
jgi:hypothetical protein